MTAQERAALWETLIASAGRAINYGDQSRCAMTFSDAPSWARLVTKDAIQSFHHARVALDAYEALKEADTLETLDEMGYDAECVIRQQWEAKRCGTCRFWFTRTNAFSMAGLCLNPKSECCSGDTTPAARWSEFHGCPHHERKDGAQ